MYKLFKDLHGVVVDNSIIRLSDNAYIPFDEQNVDYQAYLKWVAEGNVATPADEVTA
jgi:hypothetical protein